MRLTPLDIRHKDFKRGMRGYVDSEVDAFLDDVADEYERLFKESIDLHERVETLEGQVGGYKRIEETLQKTLVSAQASADELKQNASKEAELILHEADLKARQLMNDAYAEKQGVEQTMAQLRSTEQAFRFKFRQLLEAYLKHVGDAPKDAATSLDDGAAQTEFARRAEAIKAAIAREEHGAAAAAPGAGRPDDTMPGRAGAPAADTEAVSPDVATHAAASRDDAAPAEGGRAAPADEDPLRPVFPTSPAEAAPLQPGPRASTASAAESAAGPPSESDLLADVDSGVNENEFKW